MKSTSPKIGYCTNVHAGPTLEETKANLERYALRVKAIVCPDAPMGVGLWLAAPAAKQLIESHGAGDFASWLAAVGLVPFTFNGFPYGDFHQEVVKHRVYLPTWWQRERLDYTLQLITLQNELLPAGLEGTISTLPIAWGNPLPSKSELEQAAKNLCAVAAAMARLKAETGRAISVCIEPEPGCYMQRSRDIVAFFNDYLFAGNNEPEVREHLRVCHDVCHAAVMFEDQADVLKRFASEGIQIGKVQVSSAVEARFDELSSSERIAAFEQLSTFREPRYLHQTSVKQGLAIDHFFEDLPAAIASFPPGNEPSGTWRTHFHVPIYLERFGNLHATRSDIIACLAALQETSDCHHFEVETYAWGVLPPELKVAELSDGIAQEMQWFERALNESQA